MGTPDPVEGVSQTRPWGTPQARTRTGLEATHSDKTGTGLGGTSCKETNKLKTLPSRTLGMQAVTTTMKISLCYIIIADSDKSLLKRK